MIKLYLDMDGVVADFEKAYLPLRNGNRDHDKKAFAEAVMQYKIFEDLDMMPNAKLLLNHVRTIPGVTIEMLTSVGTHDPFQGNEAKRQKLHWLKKHGIPYHANFVRSFSEKRDYANDMSILVDDRQDATGPFTKAGGHGVLYRDADCTRILRELDSIVLQLRAIEAIRGA